MGKVVVITGAGQGLGRAIAKSFAARGDHVVLLGRTLSKVADLAAQLGERALAVQCDVASPDSVRAAFAEIAGHHQRIDVLINNAATYQPFTVAEGTDEQILEILNTNLAGAIFCCRQAIPLMGKDSCIINISSESVDIPFAMLSVYQGSKAGLERFTKSLAAELEPDGIRVTIVRAGGMRDNGQSAVNWDPDAARRFFDGCKARGIDLFSAPHSDVSSVTGVFLAVADLPGDVTLRQVEIGARHA